MAQRAELGEADAYAQLVTGAPAALRVAHGLSVHEVAGSRIFIAGTVTGSLMLNRVIGLGLDVPFDDRQLAEIDALYRAHGVDSYAIELSPNALPDDLAGRLRASGFVPFKQMTLMARAVEPLTVTPAACEVRRVDAKWAEPFARLACGHFELAEPYVSLVRSTFASGNWQHWLAFLGDEPVATAMTHIRSEDAWFGWVGTLAAHRGRGIQAAMTAAQLEAAREAGARWSTLETTLGPRRTPGASQRNYLRLGWLPLYNRTVYLRRTAA